METETRPVGLVHLRLVVPEDLVERTLSILHAVPSVINVVRIPGVATQPNGDFVLCDIARDDASLLVADLRDLGLAERGAISMETASSGISEGAARAERLAAGAPADAIVWEDVEARTSESTDLSYSFLAFMVLATLIAAAGILTDSVILIIGAMVVGPEFGPLAAFCVAAVSRRADLARRSAAALAVGFPVAIAVTFVATLRCAPRARGRAS